MPLTANSADTKFLESLPIVGYFVAMAHAGAGYEEEAKRAAAKCTNSTITALGTVGGGILGGPVGAMAGAAAASSVGIGAEKGVSTHINDERVRAEVGNVSVDRFIIQGGFSAISGAIGGAASLAATTALAGSSAVTATAGGMAASQAASATFASGPHALAKHAGAASAASTNS